MADRLRVPTFRTVRHDRSEVVDCHNLASARAIALRGISVSRGARAPRRASVVSAAATLIRTLAHKCLSRDSA